MNDVSEANDRVRAVGHDAREEALLVAYQDGQVWRYWNVPREIYLRLLAADCRTAFVNKEIQSEYPGKREI